jgi:hypothetical protein
MSVRPATARAIESALAFDAFYRGYLASHLPMALVALERLGASDETIAAASRRMGSELEPLRPRRAAIVAGDEARHLGDAGAYRDWVDHFEAAIAADGPERVLQEWMDPLLTGVSGGAFHGAIRVAYALECGIAGELAHALAYWAAAWQPLGPVPEARGILAPAEALARIAADPALAGRRPPGRNIAERTAAAAKDAALRAHVASVDPRSLDLEALAAAAIRAYAGSGDFTALHMVTGVHAARALVEHAADPDAAARHLWLALAAAFAGAGSPAFTGRANGEEGAGWDELRARAARCTDEHDVKIAYTCWREWQRTGDDLYRRAAHARLASALEETSP